MSTQTQASPWKRKLSSYWEVAKRTSSRGDDAEDLLGEGYGGIDLERTKDFRIPLPSGLNVQNPLQLNMYAIEVAKFKPRPSQKASPVRKLESGGLGGLSGTRSKNAAKACIKKRLKTKKIINSNQKRRSGSPKAGWRASTNKTRPEGARMLRPGQGLAKAGTGKKKGHKTWCWMHRKFSQEAKHCVNSSCDWSSYPVSLSKIQEN